MTIAPPVCTCEDSVFSSFGQPCPIHGSKLNRMEADAYRTAAARLKAENDRLRELYENVARNRKRFGWTINHLLECEEALRMMEGEVERLRAVLAQAVGDLRGHDDRLSNQELRDTVDDFIAVAAPMGEAERHGQDTDA